MTTRPHVSVVGTVVFVASASMLFAALLFAFALSRAGSPVPELGLPMGKPMLATGLVFGASVAVHRNALLPLAALAAWLFLLVQLFWWRELFATGITFVTGPSVSFTYVLTALHAVHAAVGAAALSAAAIRGSSTRGWTVYWHFVAVLWVVIAGSLVVLA